MQNKTTLPCVIIMHNVNKEKKLNTIFMYYPDKESQGNKQT